MPQDDRDHYCRSLVAFIEQHLALDGRKLHPYQRELLEVLSRLPRGRLIISRRGHYRWEPTDAAAGRLR